MKSLHIPDSPLFIRFIEMGDRWSHEFGLNEGERQIIFMKSVEGGSEDRWPPSPPIQEVELHELSEGRNAILAVGKAGVGHWSMSCSIEKSESMKDRSSIFVDNACLLPSSLSDDGAELRSTYHVSAEVEVLGQSENSLQWLVQGKQIILLELVENSNFKTERADEGSQWVVCPQEVRFEKRKSNRWGFRLFSAALN